MTDQPQQEPRDRADQGAALSRIVITFPAPGSADCIITTEGAVTGGQLMVAAWWLDEWLRRSLQTGPQTGPRIVTADHLPKGGLRRQ